MWTLVMCIGFSNGVCAEVKYEFYPDLTQCEARKTEMERTTQDVLFARCREPRVRK